MITYIPDGAQEQAAISRTTHLAISAHQDDIEFMAYAPIAECFGNQDKWFGAIVVTDGAGSPRSGLYADYTDEQMKKVRIVEQKKAASQNRRRTCRPYPNSKAEVSLHPQSCGQARDARCNGS